MLHVRSLDERRNIARYKHLPSGGALIDGVFQGGIDPRGAPRVSLGTMRRSLAVLSVLVALTQVALAGARPRPAPDAIRARLAARRATAIERLHAYAVAGQFPHDYVMAPALHMFRDDAGRYCAVANLVHLDGRDDLVEEVVRAQNDLAVADVHEGELYDWMLGSGFTQEELARIQKPAPFVERRPPSEDAMNRAMVAHLTAVEAELRASTDASLTIATQRYQARPRS
jgi:hypothetical protein